MGCELVSGIIDAWYSEDEVRLFVEDRFDYSTAGITPQVAALHHSLLDEWLVMDWVPLAELDASVVGLREWPSGAAQITWLAGERNLTTCGTVSVVGTQVSISGLEEGRLVAVDGRSWNYATDGDITVRSGGRTATLTATRPVAVLPVGADGILLLEAVTVAPLPVASASSYLETYATDGVVAYKTLWQTYRAEVIRHICKCECKCKTFHRLYDMAVMFSALREADFLCAQRIYDLLNGELRDACAQCCGQS